MMADSKKSIDFNIGDKRTVDLAEMAALAAMLAAGKQGNSIGQMIAYGFFGILIGGGIGYLSHILAVIVIVLSAIIFFS